jgi:UPF0716 protein FxsA
MAKLLLLFIAVPAVELALLIEVGRHLGTIPTLLLVVFTGMLGAFLARMQGLAVLRAAQEKMARGELPAGSVADGVLILVAAALLVTPGILTDACGFLLLVPAFRNAIKAALLRRFRRAVEENRVKVHVASFGFPPEDLNRVSREPIDVKSYPLDVDGDVDVEVDPPKYKIH